jgi:hypothetical protein
MRLIGWATVISAIHDWWTLGALTARRRRIVPEEAKTEGEEAALAAQAVACEWRAFTARSKAVRESGGTDQREEHQTG